MATLSTRLERLERIAPSRVDEGLEVARLQSLLTEKLRGIAERRRGFAPASPKMTPAQMAALRAQLAARLSACCPPDLPLTG